MIDHRRRVAGSFVAAAAIGIVIGGGGVAGAQPEARPQPEAPAARAPWRLSEAAGLPGWLRVGLAHQARVEHLASDFRAGATGDATALSLRTLLNVEATGGPVFAGLELEDARAFVSDATPVNTTLVNPVELLQAYAGLRRADALRAGDTVEARLGRITIDLGTRRLVARNRFRNTINGFTGLDGTWTSPGKHTARGFVAMPVIRLPSDEDGLRDNALELDEENRDALLWAVAYGAPPQLGGARLELFVVGFHERDGDVASRDRQLVTVGARWVRPPATARVDFDVEVMPQLGTARASSAATDTVDLDHRALSTHAEVGVSPAMAWTPRLILQHDFASGDGDPDDGDSTRFDPLFGARRFDFGPTGIYGPFARSNVQSPGLRATATPAAGLTAMASYRLFWLAAAGDAWAPAGLRDPTGDAGSFVGQHAEVQLRWSPLPKTLALEAGAAHLRRGRFARTAPDARADSATYGYLQLELTI